MGNIVLKAFKIYIMKHSLLWGLIFNIIACTPQENFPNSPTNSQPSASTIKQFIDYDKAKQIVQNKEYLTCQQNRDCTKIATPVCSIFSATNFTYKHHAQQYFDTMERAIECKIPTQTLDDFNVICQNYQCTLIEKNPTQK